MEQIDNIHADAQSTSNNNSDLARGIVALGCGLIFGAGLAASGMTSTAKVLGFLDIFGDWQADLAFVMVFALAVSGLSYHLLIKHRIPVFDKQLHLPQKTKLDRKLLSGAAIFGIGWGIYGYCPGPALASLAYFDPRAAVFVVAMLAGMVMANFAQKRFS